MITVIVEFHTNDIGRKGGNVVKKVCWNSGKIRMKRNDRHEVVGTEDPVSFNSMTEILEGIEKVLRKANVTILNPRKNRNHLTWEEFEKRRR